MAKFTDKSGQEWQVRIDVASARRMREDVSPSIRITDPESLADLLDDVEQQYLAVWELCRKQAEPRNIDAEAFAVLFTDAYVDAAKALEAALTDFFQSVGKADFVAIVERTLSASDKLQKLRVEKIRSEKATTVIQANLTRAEREMDKALDQLLLEATTDQETAGATSGGSPVS